jgi:hypothetical protein
MRQWDWNVCRGQQRLALVRCRRPGSSRRCTHRTKLPNTGRAARHAFFFFRKLCTKPHSSSSHANGREGSTAIAGYRCDRVRAAARPVEERSAWRFAVAVRER